MSASPSVPLSLSLPASRLAALLAEHWSLPGAEITPLAGGLNSHVWAVTSGERRYVAKAVAASAGEEFTQGLEAAARVEAAGLAAGAPLPAADGSVTAASDGHVLALLRHVPGEPVHGRGEADLRRIGDTLALAHLALGTATPRAELVPAIDQGPHLGVRAWVRPALARVRECAAGLDAAALTWGGLHGDPAPDAFLLDGASGECGVIDWGAYLVGPRVYDLASAVMYAGGIGRADALVAGYLERGAVGAGEAERALEVLLRWRWAVQATYFAWRISVNELTGFPDASHNERGLTAAKLRLAPPEIRAYRASDEQSWLRCRLNAFFDTCYYDDVWTSKEPQEADCVVELVAVDEGNVVVGILDVAVRGELATIECVCVLPDYRGAGLATRLLREACTRLAGSGAQVLDAWTREDEAAIGWYTRIGFTEDFTYLHVYSGYDGGVRMTGERPPYRPMAVFAHAAREHEKQARAEYEKVYVCRRMTQPLPVARFAELAESECAESRCAESGFAVSECAGQDAP
ncbi:GNAT family N-acetyltransferase [Actinospica durhamensis]|uniref:Bifunctional AAC/APH n=1 Tax=Actinospica durhamensis TaxID=1508375 RepID=A0A941ISH7_9ACTN|nr:GNAT family N-acetyltransferase [Actinospica durhamensis]MBR7838514.1 GNAT family N-acetyltransferase [Actinospica durhamensis]